MSFTKDEVFQGKDFIKEFLTQSQKKYIDQKVFTDFIDYWEKYICEENEKQKINCWLNLKHQMQCFLDAVEKNKEEK